MSGTTAGGSPGAGWFPDPAGGPHLRWWDGGAWTDHFIDPATGTPVVGDALPSRRQLREQAVEQQPAEPAAEELAPFAPMLPGPNGPAPWVSAPPPRVEDAYPIQSEPTYVPMARNESRAPTVQQVYVGSAQTASAWIFALLPLLQLGLVLAVYLQFAPSVTDPVRWVLLLFPVPIYLLLAVVDRSRLRQNGYADAPSPVLALIPPLYLVVRTVRLGAGGIGTLVAWLLAQAAAILVLLIMFPAVLHAASTFDTAADSSATPQPTTSSHVLTDSERAYELTPAGMEATITSDFAAQGISLVSVTCPPLPSTEDGAGVTCTGSLGISNMAITVSVANEFPTAAFDVVSAVPGP